MNGLRKILRIGVSRPIPPARTVADYRPDELVRFQKEFQRLSRRYREFGYAFIAIFALGALWFLVSSAFKISLTPGLVVLFVVSVILAFRVPHLHCPACNNPLDKVALGSFCPECGAPGLDAGGWLREPRCASCKRKFYGSEAGGYKLCACTYCGIILDSKGV